MCFVTSVYKNWEEICKIGKKNRMLMIILASISADGNDPIFTGLYLGFPNCFSSNKIDGPFPLSVVRSLAGECAVKEGQLSYDVGVNHPESFGVLSALGVPHTLFDINDAHEPGGHDCPFFPLLLEEAKKLRQGDCFEWKGKQLMILEINCRCQEPWAAAVPTECIVLDL